jgi:hypothetical protein
MVKTDKDKIIIKHKFLNKVLEDCHSHIVKLLQRCKKDFKDEDSTHPKTLQYIIIDAMLTNAR